MKSNSIIIKTIDDTLLKSISSDFTLIIPSVSVGNVGQLAVDVLISTLQIKKAAIFHHPAFLPVVGHDPYNIDSKSIGTAADLHICPDKKISVLQIRSPLCKELTKEFLQDLNDWCLKWKLQKVVVLGSCHAHLRHDCQMQGPQWRHLTNEKAENFNKKLIAEGSIELEERENESGIKKRRVPGAGFLYQLLDTNETPTIALMGFVDEGDNTKDAFGLVNYLNEFLHLQKSDASWKYPFSWKNLFGPPPPLSLY